MLPYKRIPYKNCLFQMLALTNTHSPFTPVSVSLLPDIQLTATPSPLSGPRVLPRDSRGTRVDQYPSSLCTALQLSISSMD